MEELIKKLQSNGMQAYYFTNSQEAKAHILNMIPSTATVGIGGSVTVREMGLLNALAERSWRSRGRW
jgi:L-lactate utilization protein LutB